MTLRSLIFWSHLSAGVVAGAVILLMSVTGVLLTYERQLIAWSESGFQSARPSDGAEPLSIDTVLARFVERHPELTPTTVTRSAEPEDAIRIAAGQRTLYVDRYSGAVLGEAPEGGVRALMADLRAWHRWLAVEGEGRPVARAITGWSNFIFLFIVMSGVYLWFPRTWRWRQVRSVVFFKPGVRGKARDFNWHNVIGAWSAIPLFVVVLSAMPISFGWFNALVYRAVGEPVPQSGRGAAARPRPSQADSAAGEAEASGAPGSAVALDPLWARAEAQVPGWRTVSLRLPASASAPAVFTIDRGDGGQPHLRSTLTLDARTGSVVSYEAFSDQTLGRRIRSTMRFAHTGEVLGLAGQTVAGLVSAGGVVLVWTGLALAWRRFRAWTGRSARRSDGSRVRAA